MTSRDILGKVVSDKMNKTVVVAVEKLTKHPKYDKIIKRTKKYKAHDELNRCCVGDIVCIRETRPISKTKRWIVCKIISGLNDAKEVNPLQCSLDINASFPDKIICKQRNNLKIDIKLSENQLHSFSFIENAADLSGTQIEAIITVSPEDFNIYDNYFTEAKTANIKPSNTSSSINFPLVSKKEFEHTEISIEFYQDSYYLGELQLKTASISK